MTKGLRRARAVMFSAMAGFATAGFAFAAGAPDLEPVDLTTAGKRAVELGFTTDEDRFEPLVYSVPRQARVRILTLSYDPDTEFLLDLYYPPDVNVEALIATRSRAVNSAAAQAVYPVVLFPLGFSVERLELWGMGLPRNNDSIVGWGSMFAAHGMVAVAYDASDLEMAFDRVVAFLNEHGDQLSLDLTRLAIWATSGQGKFSSHVMSRPEIASDLKGALFIHADARPTVLPEGDFGLHIIYSVGDHYDRLGAALARRAQLQGIPVVLETRAPYKGFDYTDQTELSRDIVRNAVEWIQERLGAGL